VVIESRELTVDAPVAPRRVLGSQAHRQCSYVVRVGARPGWWVVASDGRRVVGASAGLFGSDERLVPVVVGESADEGGR
jgi:hypothetical protein